MRDRTTGLEAISMLGRLASAFSAALLFVAALWLAVLATGVLQDSGVGLQPWHRMTPDEAYQVGTRARYAFVDREPLVFQSGPATAGQSAELAAPPQEGAMVAEFAADDGAGGTSSITFFGGLTDPSTEVVAHEYGHAVLWDYLGLSAVNRDELDVASLFREISGLTAQQPLDPRIARELPALAPVFAEYRRQPTVFGEYPAISFGEWLAQANYAYLYGKNMPPRTRAFYRGLETLR